MSKRRSITPKHFIVGAGYTTTDEETIKVGKSEYTFRAWLNATDKALEVKAKWDDPAQRTTALVGTALWAKGWLQLNEMDEPAAIAQYKNLRSSFDNPTHPVSCTCRRCGSNLTNRFSVAIGIGPECRKRHAERVAA